jgi:hypothetical protein
VKQPRLVRVLALFLLVWAAVPGGLRLAGIERGLRADYFDNSDRSGAPLFSKIDRAATASQMSADWLGDPPQVFSVRWFGYLDVDRPGQYVIGTRSDDGSWLSIDGRMVVDNGGFHSSSTRTTSVTLERGLHTVLLDYTQLAADYDIALVWGTSEASLSPVASWRLSPSRTAPWKLLLARVLDWISNISLILGILYGAWGAATTWRPSLAGWIHGRPRIASLLFFVALTVIETWPLAAHPARLSRNDNGDTVLNEWAIAWVAHEAPRAPLHIFDANIFYPEHTTLAYSESMIVQSAMAAPFLWAGASPVLAYNLVLLAGFALSGWTMTIVMERWTGSWAAALVSGVLFAFNAHTFTRLPHLQALHVEFIPLALFALDALLRRPGARQALSLAAWFALESLTSVYLLVFTAVALAAGALVRPEDWTGARFRRAAGWTLAAAALAALVLSPFLFPYWRLAHGQGMTRSLDDVIGFAASWQDYLATPGRFHYALWSQQFFVATALFPGFVGIGLSLVAIGSGAAIRNPRARMCLAFGIAGVALSFGGKLPGYMLLFRFVPLLQAIRAVSRFGYLGIVAVAMLAGFGFVELRSRLRPAAGAAITVVVLALVALEPYCAPIWFARFEGISPIYASLRDEPGAVVAELPFYSTTAAFRHAPYMLNSTRNWRPLLNGYSGFQPPSFERNVAALSDFPSTSSVDALRRDGVTDFFVHPAQIGGGVLTVLDAMPGVHRMESDDKFGIVRYHITSDGR